MNSAILFGKFGESFKKICNWVTYVSTIYHTRGTAYKQFVVFGLFGDSVIMIQKVNSEYLYVLELT